MTLVRSASDLVVVESGTIAALTDGTQRVGGTVAVSGPLTDTQIRASALPVSIGAVVHVDDNGGSITVDGNVAVTNFPATQPVSGTVAVTGALTDAQIRATALPVSLATNTPDVTDRAARLLGHVTVDNASIPVTGPLTDTQLRASAVPVSMATQSPDVTDRAARLLGHVTVDNASIAVTGPLTDTQIRASALPVSLATNTPDVTDRAARLLGHVTVDNASIAVTGPLTDTQLRNSAVPVSGPLTDAQIRASALPVSMATQTPDVTDRAARLLGHVTVDNASLAVTGTFFQATQPVSITASRADAAGLAVTNTAGTGAACTLTIPSGGAGLFHYISLIEIQLYATAARTGAAAPLLVTTTNLSGSPVWDFDTAQAIGVTIRQVTQPATPIKSAAAATATTIVAPIATTGIWRITAYYYIAT